MTFTTSRYPLFIGLFISLIIHLISLSLTSPANQPQQKKAQPFVVEMLPTPPQRETILPQQPQQPAHITKRQGALDQKVAKEQAQKGDAPEDSSPHNDAVIVAQAQLQPTKETPPEQSVVHQQHQPTMAELPTAQPETLPTLKELFQSGKNAAADIARSTQIKQRPNIENGDETLLNMRQDKLFSFFNRFKKGIYSVWNYPEESIKRRQQGFSLLKIIINRDGSVDDVKIISASGHERLDREAIAAIFKGQPYGKLPQSYPDEQLTINAYFEYTLGRSKPRIYRQ